MVKLSITFFGGNMKNKLLRLASLVLLICIFALTLTSCELLGVEQTVTFVYNNGEENGSYTVAYGTVISKPTEPERENYVFTGWYADKEQSYPYSFPWKVRSNITLYAGWALDYEAVSQNITTTAMKANVQVKAGHYKRTYYGLDPMNGATGSGIIFEVSDGSYYVLTNNHVVVNAEADESLYKVYDMYGTEYDAELLFADADYDLAVLRFSSEAELAALSLSERVPDENEPIIAIGSPGGQMNAVTYGKIKDIAVLTLEDSSAEESNVEFEVYWHTAYMYHGSSGGALLDANLNIIGINYATAAEENGDFAFGFSVPSAKVREFIEKYIGQ